MQLKKLLIDYGLPEDYDINDLTNLVPSHSLCNNRKSNRPFKKSTYLYYRSLTDSYVTSNITNKHTTNHAGGFRHCHFRRIGRRLCTDV